MPVADAVPVPVPDPVPVREAATEEAVSEAVTDEPFGVQHSSSAGPGQSPGVEPYPGRALHDAVSMHVPSTPDAEHVGAELELLELLDEAPPTVRARRALRSPLNSSRSAMPSLFGSPGAVPVRLYCQKVHAVNGDGSSGHVTPRLATQRFACPSKLDVSSNEVRTRTEV
jgi:hypothetical protein